MSSNQEYHLTAEGIDNLRTELEELQGPKREELSKRLREAIQQGDLSENADYSATKEEQAFVEGRIQEIEEILGNVVVIENKHRDIIDIGSRVTIQEKGNDPETYHLVGPQEAKPNEGRISHESPIGKAIIGHKAGDSVSAETPGGVMKLKILKVE